jgi:hypothetical protein
MPHVIIYGHNSGDLAALEQGEEKYFMFGGLRHYLDEQYMAEHSEIMLVENNFVSVFEIFAARMTDISDPAYQLDFSEPGAFQAFIERNGAPEGTERIITLSTCVGTDNDRRMIVQGALKRVAVAEAEHREGGWHINIKE